MQSLPSINYSGVKLPPLKHQPGGFNDENKNPNEKFKIEPQPPQVERIGTQYTRRGYIPTSNGGKRKRRNQRKTRKQRRRKSRKN